MGTTSSENFGKLAHYPRGASFFKLLLWHFRWGTRPELDLDKVGAPWTSGSFSTASYELGGVAESVEPKTVDGWVAQNKRPYPKNLDTIIAILFGNSSAHEAWSAELCRAYADIPARGRTRLNSRTNESDDINGPSTAGSQSQALSSQIASAAEQDAIAIINRLTEYFVGRSNDVEAIDAFVKARMEGGPRGLMVITAPPGIGKSALAAHWCKHAGQSENRRIVRHFCSMSSGAEQTRPGVIYEHLHKQINDFYGEPVGLARHMDALTHLLCKSPPDGKELVVWLDGIDEANGVVDCFVPYATGLEETLGDRVCVIISARAEPKITPAYLAPWLVGERAKTHNPEPYQLGKLLPADIEALIKNLFTVSDLVVPIDLSKRIFKASDNGWPLFVRNMIDSAIEAASEGRDIDLGESPESLLGYAKVEIERLETLTDWRDLHPIFIFLTIAKQAVSRADLEIILGKKIFPNSFPSQLRRWLNVVEDRGGRNNHMLSFAHPLLAKVFGQQLGDRPRNAEKELAKAILPLPYEDWPQYALRYLPRHLIEMSRLDEAGCILIDIEFITLRFTSIDTVDCLSIIKADWMAWYHVEPRKVKMKYGRHDPMRHLRFWNNYASEISNAASLGFSKVWLQLACDTGLFETPNNIAGLRHPQPQLLPRSLATLHGNVVSVREALDLADGAGFLSWGEDGTLRLWTTSGEAGPVMRGHDGRIYNVLTLPDGAGFLSWGQDWTLRLWTASGEAGPVMRGKVTGALALADGTGFLSWGDDGPLRLWTASGEAGPEMFGHRGAIYGALELADGAGFLSWGEDGTLRRWTASGEASPNLCGWVRGALTLADGAGFLSWGFDGTLRLWTSSGEAGPVMQGHEGGIDGALALADGAGFLSWGEDGTLRLWTTSGEAGPVMRGHDGWIYNVLTLADGAGFLSWGFDRTLRFWTASGEAGPVVHGHKWGVKGALELADGAGFLSWGFDGTLRLWTASGEADLVIHERIRGALILANGTGFLSWDEDGMLRLWAASGEAGLVIQGHNGRISGALALADGAGFLSWSIDGTWQLWTASGKAGPVMRGHDGRIYNVLTLADGAGFLSWGGDGRLRLWTSSGEAGPVMDVHKSGIDGALALADGAGFLSWGLDGTLRLWTASGEAGPVMRGRWGRIRGVLALSAGAGFLSWGEDGMLRLWTASGEVGLVIQGHNGRIRGALAHTDGAGFLSWGLDGTLRLWAASGEAGPVMHGHEGGIDGALALADGTGFLSWGEDGTLRLWTASGEAGPVMHGHQGWIDGALALADGAGFLSWGKDETLRLWTSSGEAGPVMHGHQGRIKGVLELADGAGFVSWGDDRMLRLWGPDGVPTNLWLSPDGNISNVQLLIPDQYIVVYGNNVGVVFLPKMTLQHSQH